MSQQKKSIHPYLRFQKNQNFSFKLLIEVFAYLGLYFFLCVTGVASYIIWILLLPIWMPLETLGLRPGAFIDYHMIANVFAVYWWARMAPRWSFWPAYIMIGFFGLIGPEWTAQKGNTWFFIFDNHFWGTMVLIIYAYALYIAGKKGHKKYLAKVEAAKASYKVCPHCGEEILPEAKVCKHCSRDI